MNFLNGITILLIYQLIGEITTRLLPITLPGPVLGMMLLFITLLWRRDLADLLQNTSNALLSHLSLLFIPAGVGVIIHFERIRHEWWPIAMTLLLSTVLVIMTTAAVMVGAQRLQVKYRSN